MDYVAILDGLRRVDETLAWMDLHLTRKAESLAALHTSDEVMFSPLQIEVKKSRVNVEVLMASIVASAGK